MAWPRPAPPRAAPVARAAAAARAPGACRRDRRAPAPPLSASFGRIVAYAGSPSGGNAAIPSIPPRRTMTTSRLSPGAAASTIGVTSGEAARQHAASKSSGQHRSAVGSRTTHRRLNSGEARTNVIPSSALPRPARTTSVAEPENSYAFPTHCCFATGESHGLRRWRPTDAQRTGRRCRMARQMESAPARVTAEGKRARARVETPPGAAEVGRTSPLTPRRARCSSAPSRFPPPRTG